MVSISNKKKGRYVEYSFRLPNSSIKKVSRFLKEDETGYEKYIKKEFLEKEIEKNIEYALETYDTNSIFTKDEIKKIEEMRIKYKYIINNVTKKQFEDILDRFTVNFTYETNAIENNSLTLKDVTLLVNEDITPGNKSLKEVYETRNMREAINILFSKNIKLNEKNILNLHKIVVKDTGVSLGYKKIPNFIVMRNVKTTVPENVEKEIIELLNWYNSNKDIMHPIKLAANFHGRFEKIHPFEDGNGRVGRLLINIILLEHKYPPLIIRKSHKEKYFNCLKVYDEGFTLKLEQFILDKYKKTFRNFFEEYVKYV